MLDPSKNLTNPSAQLNEASQKKYPVMDKLFLKDDGKAVEVKDIYKKESYEFRTPGLLGTDFLSRKLNPGQVLSRLSKGKKVKVKEEVELRGTYDNMASEADRSIEKQTLETNLKSTEDLEQFARVESGAQPKTDEEEIARMLESVEYKKAPDKSGDHFYEILGKNEKPISSTEAAKRLKNGEVIMLREREIDARHIERRSFAKNEYGRWLINPDNLQKNQKLEKGVDSYGRTRLVLREDFMRLNSNPTNEMIAFNSMNQLKDFLSGKSNKSGNQA